MTYRNILQNLISLSKNNYQAVIIGLFTVMILTTTSITAAQDDNFKSRISLNKYSVQPLVINRSKIQLEPGIASNQIVQLNQNPNPELIKQFMCTIAPEYQVNWKLVFAIGYHESGNYQSALARRNNNYFGRKARSGGYASWTTPEEAIRNQFEYIKNNYYSRGLTTPAAINPIYAEDSSWQYAVVSIMNTL